MPEPYTERDFWSEYRKYFGDLNHQYIANSDWEAAFAQLKPLREEQRGRESDAKYLDPYTQATGEFLEYVCGRALPNHLTGDTV